MSAITMGFAPGTLTAPAALAVVEYQYVHKETPTSRPRERWVVTDAVRWAADAPHGAVVKDVVKHANKTGGLLVFNRTDVGEEYADLFNLARKADDDDKLDRRALGVIIGTGQIPSDHALPRVNLVHRFGAKLASGRLIVGEGVEEAKELRSQLRKFASARRPPLDTDANPEDLLLATMLATQFKRFKPGLPRYLARNGQVYESRTVSADPY
jgi:hypothetical protein